jgi:chaperone BCS1
MTIIEFTHNSRMEYKAVNYISTNYAKNLDKFSTHFKRKNTRITDATDFDTHIYLHIPTGNRIELDYNGHQIFITLNEDLSRPLTLQECETKYHSVLSLEYTGGANTEENTRLLKEYLLHCGKEYYRTVQLSKVMRDKLQVYVWDENYWDQSHKWTKRSMESMSLNKEGKQLLEDVKKFISNDTEALYSRLGVPYKRNYLLHGAPGTGKTSIIRSIASELGYNIATLHFDGTLNDMKFMRAIQTIPENCILLLEDIDHIFQERKKNDEHKNAISFSGLLQCLDGFGSQYKLITMITTNFIDVLDKALIRRGRIDKMVEFKYANRDQIHHMYQRFVPEKMDQFTDFYKHVKCLKITTSILQDYLFTNMDEDDITRNITELKKTVEMTTYKDKSGELYT